MPFTI